MRKLAMVLLLAFFTLASNVVEQSDEIPPSGTYTYDVAFAEWEGKSMGAQVTVEINSDSIIVSYHGIGNLTSEVGQILDEGFLRKHKSGVWIICTNEMDVEVDEVGGCSGGPSVIDFKSRKYWMC